MPLDAQNRSKRCPIRRPLAALAGTLAILLVLTAVRGLQAVDFIRGDANGDGAVTAADAQFTLAYLFLGSGPVGCPTAMDANFDGTLDVSDAIELFLHEVGVHASLCAPYPKPGVAPGGYPSDCESYGGGEAIDVPEARVEVLDATADASGQVELQVVLNHDHEASSVSLAVAVEGDIFVADRVYGSYTVSAEEPALAHTVGEELRFVSLWKVMLDGSAYPAGEDVLVSTFKLCLDPGTPAGTYAMTIVSGEISHTWNGQAMHPTLVAGEITVPEDIPDSVACSADPLVPEEPDCDIPELPDDEPDDPGDPPLPPQDFIRGDANTDGSLSISDVIMVRRYLFTGDVSPTCLRALDVDDDGHAVISDQVRLLLHIFLPDEFTPPEPYPEIGPDPTPSGSDLSCDSFDIVEPEETDDTVRLGDVIGAPGDEVEIPVFVTSSRDLDAFQLVVRYDPAAFEPSFSSPENPGDIILHDGPIGISGSYYEDGVEELELPIGALSPLDEETFILGFIPDFIQGSVLPAGEEVHAFSIRGRIREDAEPGTTITLEPTNDLAGTGPGIASRRNEFTYRGEARFLSLVPRRIPGLLQITADIVIFRGDANDDGKVDLADPSFLLSYLFSDTKAPPCPDAADANDDGRLNITDPIAILFTIFSGQPRIAAPYPSFGPDPTGDRLGPCLTAFSR